MFKKLVLAGILVLALSAFAWAANATVTNSEWGAEITGGTSATLIYNGTMYVKGIGLVPVAANDTAVFTSGSSVSCLKIVAPIVNDTKVVSFGYPGIALTNLTVTLLNASDIVYIYNQ